LAFGSLAESVKGNKAETVTRDQLIQEIYDLVDEHIHGTALEVEIKQRLFLLGMGQKKKRKKKIKLPATVYVSVYFTKQMDMRVGDAFTSRAEAEADVEALERGHNTHSAWFVIREIK
jgi:hypothetical protein